jgi:predicted MPP superfamily phosphohydrolase
MSLFLLTFLLLYSSLHLYLVLKIKGAFVLGTGMSLVIIIVMAVMICAPILVHVLERYGWEVLARLLSYVGYTWLGLIFLFCSCALVVDLYRLVIFAAGSLLRMDLSLVTLSLRLAFVIPALVSVAISSYGYFEARVIRIEEVMIKTPKVPEEIDRFTICQISDVHLGLIVREERLKKIITLVKQVRPDVLVATGDLVDGQIDNMSDLATLLQAINPPYGKFAVTGNHEFYAGLDQALDFIGKAGFTALRGEARDVAGFMTIVGVDDPAGRSFGPVPGLSEQALLAAARPGNFALLLKHRPIVDKKTEGLFDLQLSGHTHKGQIFPFTLFVKLSTPYDTGLVHLGQRLQGSLRDSLLYVSRGTGTWGPPIRFLAPPEVTVITLVHADN